MCLLYKVSFILGPSFSQTSWLTAFFFLPGLQKEEKRTDYLLMLPCLDHKVYSVAKCPPATLKEGIWWIAFKTLKEHLLHLVPEPSGRTDSFPSCSLPSLACSYASWNTSVHTFSHRYVARRGGSSTALGSDAHSTTSCRS